jgi:predicted enzyme related to lactoylglutathione lyase
MSVPEGGVHYLEIVSADVGATCALLEAVHGWSFAPPDPTLGGARVAALPGGGRCGVRASMHEQERPIVRTYLRVGDLAAAVARAEAQGALIALPPMPLGDLGTIAIAIHAGVEQGWWQLP